MLTPRSRITSGGMDGWMGGWLDGWMVGWVLAYFCMCTIWQLNAKMPATNMRASGAAKLNWKGAQIRTPLDAAASWILNPEFWILPDVCHVVWLPQEATFHCYSICQNRVDNVQTCQEFGGGPQGLKGLKGRMWQADDAAICGCKMRLTPAKKEARSQDIRSSARTLEQDVRKLAGFNCTCPMFIQARCH